MRLPRTHPYQRVTATRFELKTCGFVMSTADQ
ncbi:hypothetical protein KLK06_52370 [Nonomuraea sp. NEAU-A123]|nr:hypothetical protein [Nonomuraea sp. NEAU-A123]